MNKLFLILILFISHDALSCSRTLVQLDSFSPSAIRFDSATTSQTINFTVTHNAPTTDCLYFVSFDYGTATTWTDRALSFGSDNIPYNIYKTTSPSAANILRNQQDVTSTNQIVYFPIFNAAGGSTTNSHSLYAEIGAVDPNLPPGVYTSSLVAKLNVVGDGALATWPVVHERALTFYYVVESNIHISLAPTGGAFDQDSTVRVFNFSSLSTGESQSADIRIQTNVGYRLYVNSTNNGNLKHTTEPNLIPYTLTVNGSAISLVGGGPGTPIETSSSNFLSGSEEAIPLNVTIGTVGTPPSGAYQDIVSFTIEAF